MYFARDIFTLPRNTRIIARFNDGSSDTEYTADILYLLLSEPIVEDISDAETGEVYFHR